MRLYASGLILSIFWLVGCTAVPVATKSGTSENGRGRSSSIGIINQDSRWIGHTDYIDGVLTEIRDQWYKIIEESRVAPPRGSHVVITFKINSKGETDIIKVEDSGVGKVGVFCCLDAITYTQPYRKWTVEMIAALSNEQQLTLSFYYQ